MQASIPLPKAAECVAILWEHVNGHLINALERPRILLDNRLERLMNRSRRSTHPFLHHECVTNSYYRP
jgi:hypothetical protein